jgi:hypothetical protein
MTMTEEQAAALQTLMSELPKLIGTVGALDNPLLTALLERAQNEVVREMSKASADGEDRAPHSQASEAR